mmetsp:Transcript_10156/g.18791  ORF Transcript_10156/g.18791 Transcript_10156/m.18791 type:complete len:133 (+) Transcript_10156:67-465(+)
MASDLVQRVTIVASDQNWKTRVKTELEIGMHWKDNWGFLAQKSNTNDSLDEFHQKESINPYHSFIEVNMRDSLRKKKLDSRDSIDTFLLTASSKYLGRPLPKQEFKKPTITSHDYGWGSNLERFGRLTLTLK